VLGSGPQIAVRFGAAVSPRRRPSPHARGSCAGHPARYSVALRTESGRSLPYDIISHIGRSLLRNSPGSLSCGSGWLGELTQSLAMATRSRAFQLTTYIDAIHRPAAGSFELRFFVHSDPWSGVGAIPITGGGNHDRHRRRRTHLDDIDRPRKFVCEDRVPVSYAARLRQRGPTRLETHPVGAGKRIAAAAHADAVASLRGNANALGCKTRYIQSPHPTATLRVV